MAKKKETALATTTRADMAPAPDYLDEGRDGFETVDVKDVMFERLSLMQDMSPAVKAGEFEVGDVVRKSTGEKVYSRGMEKPAFTIAYYFKEYVEFGDRSNPNDAVVIDRTTDRNSKLAEEARQWKKKKQADGKMVRKVQDVHNFVIMMEGREHEPMMVGFMRSNWKHGSGLLNLANSLGDRPIYAGRFLLFSDDETNRKNQTFAVVKAEIQHDDCWANAETYQAAKDLNAMLKQAFKEGKLSGGEYNEEDAADEGTVDAEAETDM